MSRLIPALVLMFGLMPGLASAQAIEADVLAQLNDQGFTEITVSKTLLGRLHILAYGNGYRREIVLNPNTGEILRDYLVLIGEDGQELPSAPRLVSTGSGSPTSTGSDDHESGDDDRDQDSRDDKSDDNEKDHH